MGIPFQTLRWQILKRGSIKISHQCSDSARQTGLDPVIKNLEIHFFILVIARVSLRPKSGK